MTDLTYTLDQIDAACENATDGPWEAFRRGNALGPFGVTNDHGIDVVADVMPIRCDAEFIALARTALPELAAKVRELEALLAHTTCGRVMAVELSSRIHAENAALDAVRRAEKAEAALARVQALTGWTQVGRDTNGVDRLVPASEILAALKETP